jgi:hypothetical protein
MITALEVSRTIEGYGYVNFITIQDGGSCGVRVISQVFLRLDDAPVHPHESKNRKDGHNKTNNQDGINR